MPPFVLGLLLITFLALIPRQLHNQTGLSWFPYLPISGVTDLDQDDSFLNHLYHLVLPATTLDWESTQVQTASVEGHGKRGEIFQDNAASGVQTCAH